MKKIILLYFLLFPIVCISQVRIQMEESGGIFKIPCEVNGLRMKFIFDTGASNVCLSLSEARFMLENDYIKPDDILGSSKSQIADGSIVENTKILLREIKISGLILKDVEAVVTHSFGAPLLLGQSAIQKLGAIQIDGNELIILEHNNINTQEKIDKLFEEAERYYNNESYIAASKKYQELHDIGVLSDYGIYWLASSYDYSQKYNEALYYYNKIKDFSHIDKSIYYSKMGWCYNMVDKYDDALYCFELQGEFAEDDSDFINSKSNIAYTYKYKGDYYNASKYFNVLVDFSLHKKNLSLEEGMKLIMKGKLKDDDIDKYIYEMCFCEYMKNGQPTSGIKTIIALAKKGNKYALKYVEERNLEELLYD